MGYELTSKQYSGPLDALLHLIEERKLEVTEISLAQVTEDFLEYVRRLETVSTGDLADFLVVASKLLLIKSKQLLPDLVLSEDEEADIHELEDRLKLYRELKPMMKHLAMLWAKKKSARSRPYLYGIQGMSEESHLFYPGQTLTKETLVHALQRIFESIQKLEVETEVMHYTVVTIEEKIEEILKRITEEPTMSFKGMSRAKNLSEVIALFLAILHLAREQQIFLEQHQSFSDIVITNPHE